MENNLNELVQEKTDKKLNDNYLNSHDYQSGFVVFVLEIANRKLPNDSLD